MLLRRAGVNICVESGDLPAAQGVVSDMRAAGLPPDLQAYNILVGRPLHGPAPVEGAVRHGLHLVFSVRAPAADV